MSTLTILDSISLSSGSNFSLALILNGSGPFGQSAGAMADPSPIWPSSVNSCLPSILGPNVAPTPRSKPNFGSTIRSPSRLLQEQRRVGDRFVDPVHPDPGPGELAVEDEHAAADVDAVALDRQCDEALARVEGLAVAALVAQQEVLEPELLTAGAGRERQHVDGVDLDLEARDVEPLAVHQRERRLCRDVPALRRRQRAEQLRELVDRDVERHRRRLAVGRPGHLHGPLERQLEEDLLERPGLVEVDRRV